MEHREEVHGAQRQMRYLLWDRAQTEKGGNGRAVQQRGKGRMEIFQRTQKESPMTEQAVRIVSTLRVESLLQSLVTWRQLSEIQKEQWHQSQTRAE